MNGNRDLVWAEPLPDNCPPEDAWAPNNDVYYRLAENFPPTEEDFYSVRKFQPKRNVNVSECQARSLSVFDNAKRCNEVRKFPTLKDKIVIKIILPAESGVIKQTGNSHYSWWKLAKFDPIPYCSLPQ